MLIFSTLSNDIPTNDICEGEMKDVRMCPTCDEFCGYETLQQSCRMIQAKYLFDNGASVFFAWFMSLWSVVFIEFWKRYSAEITHRWNVFGYDPDEVSELFGSWLTSVMCHKIMHTKLAKKWALAAF